MSPAARSRELSTHRIFNTLVYGSLLLQAVAAPVRPEHGVSLQKVGPEQLRSSHARSLQQYDEDLCTSGLWMQWTCTSNPDNGFITTLVRNVYANFGCPGDPISSWRVPDLDTPDYFGCQDRKDLGFDNGYMLTCNAHDRVEYLVYPHDETCAVESDGPYPLGCTCFEQPSDYGDYGSDSSSDDTDIVDPPCTAHTDCGDGKYCYTTGRHNAESGFCDGCLGCFKYLDAIDEKCPTCVSPNATIDSNGTVAPAAPTPPLPTSAPAQLEIGAMIAKINGLSAAQEEAADVQPTRTTPLLIVAGLCCGAVTLVVVNNMRARATRAAIAQPALELELEAAVVQQRPKARAPVRDYGEECEDDDETAPLVQFNDAVPLRPKATLPDWGVSGRF